MPAYYDDCGTLGHHGDSELVMIEVVYDSTSRHWKFRQMWISAHYRSGPTDRSRWITSPEFPDRSLGHPRVYVSSGKHANYASRSKCNDQTGWAWGDSCNPGGAILRWATSDLQNTGSRHTDILGCVRGGPFPQSDRTECFFTDKPFNGWHSGTGGVTPYWSLLVSDKFECQAEIRGCSNSGDWGPGPNPPPGPPQPPLPQPEIIGPFAVRPNAICSWSANVFGASGSVTYNWFAPGGSGTTQYFDYQNSGSDFYIQLQVTDSNGFQGFATLSVIVSPDAKICLF